MAAKDIHARPGALCRKALAQVMRVTPVMSYSAHLEASQLRGAHELQGRLKHQPDRDIFALLPQPLHLRQPFRPSFSSFEPFIMSGHAQQMRNTPAISLCRPSLEEQC